MTQDKKNLKKAITICLNKDYHFSVNPQCGTISMSFDAYKSTHFTSYYRGILLGFENGDTIPLVKLLTLLQSKK